MSNSEPAQNKTWELSLYEMQRKPHEVITDNTEIAVSPRSLHNELMCPICLDMLKKTMTTKECLHRFCSDCIITALRSGNKECPTCRKKLVSKRSLRADPNFDLLISKIYPSREEYEAIQEKVMAKFNQTQSQQALVNSINEGMKLQSQNRPQRFRTKGNGGSRSSHSSAQANRENENNSNDNESDSRDQSSMSGSAQTATTGSAGAAAGFTANASGGGGGAPSNRMQVDEVSNPPSTRSTPSPVPSNSSSTKPKREMSVFTSERSEESESDSQFDMRTEGDSNIDTEGEAIGELTLNDEIELVFKTHPTEVAGDNQLYKALKENGTRYIKTTANATIDHLSKYLAMRMALDLGIEPHDAQRMFSYSIYIAPQPQQLVPLSGAQNLYQINDKFWKVNKPMEMYYSWKKL